METEKTSKLVSNHTANECKSWNSRLAPSSLKANHQGIHIPI